MKRHLRLEAGGPTTLLAGTVIVATALAAATGTARADDSEPCSSSTKAPYGMQLRALTGPARADLTLTITASGCAVPDELKKVQLKIFGELWQKKITGAL